MFYVKNVNLVIDDIYFYSPIDFENQQKIQNNYIID